ncbi:MAG: carboxypeptidase M32 [Lachnospiraceae bacterium]|nr:carboxypeptidase M32 [Lachnospiraceae bacterium]
MSDTLKQFKEYLEIMSYYEHAGNQLYWDMQTQTPEKGYENKVDTLTYFSTQQFKMATAPEYGEMLEKLSAPEEFAKLDEGMKITVKRRKRDFDKFVRVPEKLHEEMVREQALAQRAWEKAKRASDYSVFCPHLKKLIELTKQQVQYTDPGKEIYDVLLNEYEEGMNSETVDRLFEEMKEGLRSLLQKIMEKQEPDRKVFEGEYPVHKQKELGAFLLDYIGFDAEAGVMGESEHPFTMGFGAKDVRVTNHYHVDNAIDPIFSIIHEGGHAIFEQNVDEKYEKTDVAQINLLGLHESQSRFFENILGRNINFWKPIYDKVGEYLPKFREISLEQFEREINHVVPSFIRTEADELTYGFHVILRYEIEKAIFREGVEAEKLPELWNQKMEELLGVVPENDAQGILQDTHWAGGSFGYFPTYLLGTIYDGMFLEALEKELGSVDEILAAGRVKEITKWLNEKIHKNGSMYTSAEVVKRICGSEISAEPILCHFKKKYIKLYDL